MAFLEIEHKEDSLDKIAQTAGKPTKFFLKASELNKTVEAINVLDERIVATSQNRILVNTGFSIVGTVFILNALCEWLIYGTRNKNLEEIRRNIVLSQAGLERRDAVILKVNNDVEILKGNEVVAFPTLPQIPDDAILLTDFPVTDSAIGAPTLPVIGVTFMKKIAFSDKKQLGSGFTSLIIDAELGGFRFEGTNATFESVFVYNIDALFVGKPFFIKNAQAIELAVKNMTGIGYKFSCPDGIDLVAQPGQTLPWEWRLNNANVWYLEYVGYIPATKFKTITGNTILDNSYDQAIVMVKASCTITVPANLKKGFNCTFRTYSGVTAVFVEGILVSFDAPKGKIMDPFRLITLYKDGSNLYVLEGGLR